MFSRKLTDEERQLLKKIEAFAKEKHAPMDCHDYSHVLQVAEFAVEIANHIEEEVEPVVVICGALLHDIGRTISDQMHGLVGGSMAAMSGRSFTVAIWIGRPGLRQPALATPTGWSPLMMAACVTA